MIDLDYHIAKYIENMPVAEKDITRSLYREQSKSNKTEYHNYIDWLWDHVHSKLFEGGEE